MPNWCDNDLTIGGPIEHIEEMFEKTWSPVDGEVDAFFPDFDKIIPYPADWKRADEEHKVLVDAWMAKNPEDRGRYPYGGAYSELGYHWCISNWGTKWYVTDSKRFLTRDFPKGRRVIRTTFDTAWSPPVGVLAALSKAYPTLLVDLRCFEMGSVYKAHLRWKAGGLLIEETAEYHGERGG